MQHFNKIRLTSAGFRLMALLFLMGTALPMGAQEEAEDAAEAVAAPKKKTKTVKKYPTIEVSGKVVDAATGEPLAGAQIQAYNNKNYTAMTGEDGTFVIKVPKFVTSIAVNLEGYNLNRTALNGRVSGVEVALHSDLFLNDYKAKTSGAHSVGMTGFETSTALTVDDEIQNRLSADIRTIQRSASRAQGASMFINGYNSLNANAQPLIVLDGVIYDQLATIPPMLCYGENHGHTVPAVVYEQDRKALLEYLHDQMNAIDPQFLVMTEGVSDCEVNRGAPLFHEHSLTSRIAVRDPQSIRDAFATEEKPFFTVFPDMFHYTIPEADFTVRTPTPASTHNSINFGTVFGYKQEIETRYYPDKLYLTENRIPAWEEYDIVKGSKPPYSTLKDQDPVEVAAYSHAVLTFRQEHADLFYDGTFSSDDGFTLNSESPYVIARSYINGNRMGVIAWNISDDAPVTFDITPDKGWKLVEITAPEGSTAEGPLPAQHLRLFVFER